MRQVKNRRIPESLDDFASLPVNEQGGLWPRCKTCDHIAQSHDTHISKPLKNNCCEMGPGQCPECNHWVPKVRCKCMGYDGPESVEGLIRFLNE